MKVKRVGGKWLIQLFKWYEVSRPPGGGVAITFLRRRYLDPFWLASLLRTAYARPQESLWASGDN